MTDFGNVLNDVRYAVTETQVMATTVLKSINDWSEKGGTAYKAKSYDEAVEQWRVQGTLDTYFGLNKPKFDQRLKT